MLCFLINVLSFSHFVSSFPRSDRYITDKRLSAIIISVEDIRKIIRNLDSNKVHGHGYISIPVLKICGDSIRKLLEMVLLKTFS